VSKKVSGRQAAIDVLREAGGPLPIKQVTEEAAKRAQMKGKTPTATVAATIYTDAKKDSPTFVIVGRGVVALADQPQNGKAAEPVDESSPAVTPGTVVVRDGNGKSEAKPDPKPKDKSRQKATA
jgi:hypothetical protein